MATTHRAAGNEMLGTSAPLAETHDVGLLDLDGVVYLGGVPIPSAAEAIGEARRRGMRLAFVTNNASRTPLRIAAQLNELGIDAAAADVVTSAQAAARLVAERVAAGAPVLVAGGIGLRQALREQGLRPVSSARDQPAAVVQGYNPHVDYGSLAEGALAVRQGAVFVAANADATMPTPRGPLPGNGSMLAVIATATGQEPLVAGKPELPLFREAVLRTRARHPLVVGDRLDTDIESATRSGSPSLLVLTGVTEPGDVVMAPEHLRPTYLARDLRGLLHPHTPARRSGGAWICGEWSAYNDRGALRLEWHGRGERREPRGSDEEREDCGALGRWRSAANGGADGLRALCAAAWSGSDPLSSAALARALRRLS